MSPLTTLNRPDLRRAPPAIVLLIANLVPAVGVLLGGWNLLEVVALYWFENVVIGAINVLKMITCAPDIQHLRSLESGETPNDRSNYGQSKRRLIRSKSDNHWIPAQHHALKAFFVPFFIFHYGMFCSVHGVFIFALFGGQAQHMFGDPLTEMTAMVTQLLRGDTKYAAIALIASHLISYFYHFLWRREFRRTSVPELMGAPYGRIVLLHLAIIFGGFATMLLGQPMIMLILLIIGKTLFDWQMHVRAHAKLADRDIRDEPAAFAGTSAH